jgi:hypothetical protein
MGRINFIIDERDYQENRRNKLIQYGVRVSVKIPDGIIVGDVRFAYQIESFEQADQKAQDIAENIGSFQQLTLTDPENEKVYITLGKELLSRYPVFVTAVSKVVN